MTTQPPVQSPPALTNAQQTAAAIIAARIKENQIVPDAEGTISAREAALVAQVSARLIRNWGEEGEIPWISRMQEKRIIHRYPLDGVIACAERRAYMPRRTGRGRLSNQELAAAVALSEQGGAADRDEREESALEAKAGLAEKGSPIAPVSHAERRAAVPPRPSRGRSGNQDLAAAVVLSEPNSAADLDQVRESETEEKGGPAAKAATVAHAEQRDAVPARGATDRAATPVREGAAGVGDQETREAPPAAPLPFRTPSPAPLADRPDAPAPEWVGTLLCENRATQEAQSQMGAELRAQAAVMIRVVEKQSALLADDRDRERHLHDEITRLHAEITRLQAQNTHLHATVTQQITLLHQYHEVLGASRGLTLLPPPATPGEMDRPSAIPHPFPRP